jgi:hypothetical protein
VLDAIYWISNSWNDLDNSTIQKCFKRCGFIHQENVENNTDNESDDDESDDVPLIVLQMANDYKCHQHYHPRLNFPQYHFS